LQKDWTDTMFDRTQLILFHNKKKHHRKRSRRNDGYMTSYTQLLIDRRRGQRVNMRNNGSNQTDCKTSSQAVS